MLLHMEIIGEGAGGWSLQRQRGVNCYLSSLNTVGECDIMLTIRHRISLCVVKSKTSLAPQFEMNNERWVTTTKLIVELTGSI